MRFVDALLASPGVQLASRGSDRSKRRPPGIDKRLSGNAVPEAWTAAAVASLGEHLVSFDRDFRTLPTRHHSTLLLPAKESAGGTVAQRSTHVLDARRRTS